MAAIDPTNTARLIAKLAPLAPKIIDFLNGKTEEKGSGDDLKGTTEVVEGIDFAEGIELFDALSKL
jgi:hypothetical protein